MYSIETFVRYEGIAVRFTPWLTFIGVIKKKSRYYKPDYLESTMAEIGLDLKFKIEHFEEEVESEYMAQVVAQKITLMKVNLGAYIMMMRRMLLKLQVVLICSWSCSCRSSIFMNQRQSKN